MTRAADPPTELEAMAAWHISARWDEWMVEHGYPEGTPIGNQMAAALYAIETIRGLPVKQRMELMGMRTSMLTPDAWVENDGE